jgi:hypothetical protein
MTTNINIEDLKKLKIKYTEKLERYRLKFNEETVRTIEKLKEIEKQIEDKTNINHIWNGDKTKYSKYCPNYDSDLDK